MSEFVRNSDKGRGDFGPVEPTGDFVIDPNKGRDTFGPQDGETQVESSVPAPTRQELGGSATFGSGVEPNPWAITPEQAAERAPEGGVSALSTMVNKVTAGRMTSEALRARAQAWADRHKPEREPRVTR